MKNQLLALSLAVAFLPGGIAAHAKGSKPGKPGKHAKALKPPMPPGAPHMWQDRGELTPARCFWGVASDRSDPAARLPQPPFSHFVQDVTPNAYSPKCKCTDANGVKWTVKFGKEVHADTVGTRLAWALGYAADEEYNVQSGVIQGVTSGTSLGKAKGWVKSDGSFVNARFKIHDDTVPHVTDASGEDKIWDEAVNPGVPAEQLAGLKILDVMVHNWDAQPKNCKIIRMNSANGPEDWYTMSDWGESFGQKPGAWNLNAYSQESAFIKDVSAGVVNLHFADAISAQTLDHSRIPLSGAQWFRGQLAKLTDDDLRACFNAGIANGALYQAYQSGDQVQINSLTPPEVNGFVAQFRRRIQEFMSKTAAGS